MYPTPTPTPTASPDGHSQVDRGFEGTDDHDDNDHTDDGRFKPSAPTSAPSTAPTFAIDGDGGIDRDVTPAPTDHAEDLWDWWHQEGTPRADRGQALATGLGEYADLRFLVGTEDGVVAIDPEESLGENLARLRIIRVVFVCEGIGEGKCSWGLGFEARGFS